MQLDSSSATLALLTVFDVARGKPGRDASTIPGYIEAIKVEVADGILTYKKFSVQIDKLTLVYSGTVDLIKQTVNLRTEVPLGRLVSAFGNVRELPPDTMVPLITTGPIANPVTNIDPAFFAKMAEDVIKKEVEDKLGGFLKGLIGD